MGISRARLEQVIRELGVAATVGYDEHDADAVFVLNALSFLLSAWLQQMVASPISALASTARDIAARGDYSIRAQRSWRVRLFVCCSGGEIKAAPWQR